MDGGGGGSDGGGGEVRLKEAGGWKGRAGVEREWDYSRKTNFHNKVIFIIAQMIQEI